MSSKKNYSRILLIFYVVTILLAISPALIPMAIYGLAAIGIIQLGTNTVLSNVGLLGWGLLVSMPVGFIVLIVGTVIIISLDRSQTKKKEERTK